MMKNKLSNLSFAIFLIFFGFVALLVTYDYVTWNNIFNLFFRFWPVLVIVGGLKLIVGSFKYGEYINLIIDVILNLLICFALLFYGNIDDRLKDSTFFFRSDSNIMKEIESKDLSVTTDEFSKNLVTSVEYSFKVGASRFTVYNGGEDKYFLNTSGKYNSSWFDPMLDKKFDEGKLSLDFYQKSPKPMMFGMGWWDREISQFDFQIGMSDIPSKLKIDLGAGEGDVNMLSPLTQVNANVGAGELVMDLSNLKGDVDISVGAGNVILKIPKELIYLLDYSVGAGNVRIMKNGDVIKEFGGIAAKGDWGTNTDQSIKIKVNVGAGNVDIVSK